MKSKIATFLIEQLKFLVVFTMIATAAGIGARVGVDAARITVCFVQQPEEPSHGDPDAHFEPGTLQQQGGADA